MRQKRQSSYPCAVLAVCDILVERKCHEAWLIACVVCGEVPKQAEGGSLLNC